jgi:hypothetical protein
MMFFGIPVAVVVAWVMGDSDRQLEIEEKGRTGIRMGNWTLRFRIRIRIRVARRDFSAAIGS